MTPNLEPQMPSGRHTLHPAIADRIRQRIANGDYPPGSRLPTVSALAEDFGVSANTVQRAMISLEAESLILTFPAKGRWVAGGDPPEPYPHKRIVMELRKAIANGEYPLMSRMPNEKALSYRYEVSQYTMRRAIDELESEGLLKTVHGKGRYVVRSVPASE
ncbi:GntR family transcriptional regulator [Streptosporangiaceae bacterium NEAU-GS5]|nr:GntR family transcriptional regulator [Streptosporangiaceae bacterium NEAU-GS5]